MQVYPGYTVEKIERELSYREVDELCKFWRKSPPYYADLRMIKQMLASYLGVDLNEATESPSIDRTIELFRLYGF